MSLRIEVVEDPARACAAMLIGAAADAGHVVLAGGSTPRAAYEEFVRAARAVDLGVAETTLWFGDERCVSPEDERSNYRMVREAMLDPLGEAAPRSVHRIRGELGPDDAADVYERELREAGPPRFDLVLLGVGTDGHTASLFPGQSSLDERSRLVIGVDQAALAPFVPRVTLTLPALASAAQVVFLASGAAKANAVAAAFGSDAALDPRTPCSVLVSLASEVTVLLDGPAAERL